MSLVIYDLSKDLPDRLLNLNKPHQRIVRTPAFDLVIR